ncbi:MAG: hydrolase [Haloarculaceae archaeon]
MEWHAAPVGDSGAEQPVDVPGRPAAFAGEESVRYTATADSPADAEAATLVLDGVYAHAEVEVTGDRLGGEGTAEHDAYFEPVRVPLRPEGSVEVSVTCHAPRDRFGGLHDTDLVPDERAVPGIWWDARLEPHPLPAIADLRVRAERTGDGARLHVRTTVVTGGPLEERVTYSLRPEGELSTRGTMERGSVEADSAGLTTVEHTVEVRDPALWWPHPLGDQHRYTLAAKLGDSERSITTGICEVAREDGHLLVNGERLPVRGVNLLTDDPADVERALDVNATLVRGHAQALPPAVYEACDEAGLLVWQDLPLTGPGDFDVGRGEDLVARLAARYGTHPSLAAVGVHDDPVDAFADSLGSGLLDRLRLRWRAWRTSYDRTAAVAVADALPDGLAAVPVVGGPGVDHDAAAYYPGWDYGEATDVDRLLERYPADLLAEFGAGALASADDSLGPTHDARVSGGVEDSQAYQADVLATVAGRARRRGAGVVAFALRDPAGSEDGGSNRAGMGVYAADGEQKAGRDALATAFEPVQAFVDPASGSAAVVNDRPEVLAATLCWAAGDETGEREVDVDPMGRWAGDLGISGGAEDVRLELEVDGWTVADGSEL